MQNVIRESIFWEKITNTFKIITNFLGTIYKVDKFYRTRYNNALVNLRVAGELPSLHPFKDFHMTSFNSLSISFFFFLSKKSQKHLKASCKL
jgi:hypothetical protein